MPGLKISEHTRMHTRTTTIRRVLSKHKTQPSPTSTRLSEDGGELYLSPLRRKLKEIVVDSVHSTRGSAVVRFREDAPFLIQVIGGKNLSSKTSENDSSNLYRGHFRPQLKLIT